MKTNGKSGKGSQLETHIWIVGYRLNHLDESVSMPVPKPMLTEVGIHYMLESCVELCNIHISHVTCKVLKVYEIILLDGCLYIVGRQRGWEIGFSLLGGKWWQPLY